MAKKKYTREELASYQKGGDLCPETLTEEVLELHSKIDNMKARFDGFLRDIRVVLDKYTETQQQLDKFRHGKRDIVKNRELCDKYLEAITKEVASPTNNTVRTKLPIYHDEERLKESIELLNGEEK